MRSHPRAMAALTLIVPLLSGCMGGSADDQGIVDASPGSNATQTQVEQAEKATFNATTGGLEGFVASDVGARLKGAHVFLRGTEFSTLTDASGAFSFSNLTPAGYPVRVDHEGYVPYEGEVNVTAGKVTRLEVTLVARLGTPAGFREHLHDLWLGEERRQLFSGPLQYESSLASGGSSSGARVCVPSFSVNGGDPCWKIRIPLESGVTVLPGTRALELTVKWASTQFVNRVEFRFLPSNSNKEETHAIENGKPLEVPIPYEWNDHGHQTTTLWRFNLYVVYGAAGQTISQGDLNRRLGPTFDTTLSILKGQVQAEPAHKAHWAQGDRVLLVDKLLRDVRTSPPTPFTRDPKVSACPATNPCFTFPADVVVPPGTTRLLVTLEYAPGTPAASSLMAERVLSFRTAAANPDEATLQSLRHDAPSQSRFGNATWSLSIKPEEADAFYQKKSLWAFLLAKKGDERADQFHEDCVWTGGTVAGCGGTKHWLTIVAVNDNWTPDLVPPAEPGR